MIFSDESIYTGRYANSLPTQFISMDTALRGSTGGRDALLMLSVSLGIPPEILNNIRGCSKHTFLAIMYIHHNMYLGIGGSISVFGEDYAERFKRNTSIQVFPVGFDAGDAIRIAMHGIALDGLPYIFGQLVGMYKEIALEVVPKFLVAYLATGKIGASSLLNVLIGIEEKDVLRATLKEIEKNGEDKNVNFVLMGLSNCSEYGTFVQTMKSRLSEKQEEKAI